MHFAAFCKNTDGSLNNKSAGEKCPIRLKEQLMGNITGWILIAGLYNKQLIVFGSQTFSPALLSLEDFGESELLHFCSMYK